MDTIPTIEQLAAALPADAPWQARRHDGWTPERQRTFLDAIAAGQGVRAACRIAGMAVASAYSFRDRASGRLFAAGWSAASQVAYQARKDRRIAHCVPPREKTITRRDGTTVRRPAGVRSALARLTGLDKAIESSSAESYAAARRIAGDFEYFLDLLDRQAAAGEAAPAHREAER